MTECICFGTEPYTVFVVQRWKSDLELLQYICTLFLFVEQSWVWAQVCKQTFGFLTSKKKKMQLYTQVLEPRLGRMENPRTTERLWCACLSSETEDYWFCKCVCVCSCVSVCMCVHLTVCVCFKGKLACSPGTKVADVATDMVTLTAGYIIQTNLHGCTFDCLIHIISIETFVL